MKQGEAGLFDKDLHLALQQGGATKGDAGALAQEHLTLAFTLTGTWTCGTPWLGPWLYQGDQP